jgi:membrane protease subunit (stomatin/prohibitin family)
MGLVLVDTFVVENLSLPEELQERLDERIGMTIVGDMAGTRRGWGAAGVGAGLGAGMMMAQTMMGALQHPAGLVLLRRKRGRPPAPRRRLRGGTKYCLECGQQTPQPAKFCPECGKPQQ